MEKNNPKSEKLTKIVIFSIKKSFEDLTFVFHRQKQKKQFSEKQILSLTIHYKKLLEQ